MANPFYREITLSLLPHQAASSSYIISELKKSKELQDINIKNYKIKKRSIDARKTPVKVNLTLIVSDQEDFNYDYPKKNYKKVDHNAPVIIIVGAGPAGLFAGLRALEYGIRPIILERGKDVDERRKDIAKISREGFIDPNSNYCFGEGGAGAFSDGKLFTRSKKRGNVEEVLQILHQFGSSEDILISSHPHIGSDKLPLIIKNIRNTIIDMGGEVRFNTLVKDLLIQDKKAIGVITEEGEKILGPVFLATGHSARDTYRLLKEKGVRLSSKGIAIGVRLEHPQTLIDKIQYHNKEGRGKYLPPAEYSFVHQVDQRGVYTFCMCPGGVIVPSMSDNNQMVVNGMSASARSGKWANSGYVVELHPGDIPGFDGEDELEILSLQEYLEKNFSIAARNCIKAPAQKIPDFINGKLSEDLPATSYAPGIFSADFNSLFPKEISHRLKEGLKNIGKKCPDFVSDKGLIIGLESRTSSPVRIPRDSCNMQHIEIENLYPIGEGAGYAGGIVSSALDGINSIDAFYETLKQNGHNT